MCAITWLSPRTRIGRPGTAEVDQGESAWLLREDDIRGLYVGVTNSESCMQLTNGIR
jgi:hypothetical protein